MARQALLRFVALIALGSVIGWSIVLFAYAAHLLLHGQIKASALATVAGLPLAIAVLVWRVRELLSRDLPPNTPS